MKIAINNLPLKSGHKHRGIGYYTRHLVEALKMDQSISITEFVRPSEVESVDVVHYPWFDLYFHTLPIKKTFPTVITVHDVIPLVFPKHYPVGIRGRINFMMQKIALGNCKYIITDSEASKEDIIKYLKIERKKIVVIPLAADCQFRVFENDTKLLLTKRRYNLPDRFLLYVGDVNWTKNLSFLIEGFRQLVVKPGLEDTKLVLIGGAFLKNVENIDHPELESLKLLNRLIKQYNLEPHIIKPGRIEDEELVAFYNLATAYIQPSIYEGFGLPVLQAFACGTPVICSDRSSLSEVGGPAAFYFDPTNIKEFVEVTQKLIGDKSLQKRFSLAGLERAKRFSWEKVAEETKRVYIKAISDE